MTHPATLLDEVVHQRFRLGILTIAAEADRVEFSYLRDALELTPGNLSRHLDVLHSAHLVDIDKGYQGRRARTWIRITRTGRAALTRELEALRALVNRSAELPAARALPGPRDTPAQSGPANVL